MLVLVDYLGQEKGTRGQYMHMGGTIRGMWGHGRPYGCTDLICHCTNLPDLETKPGRRERDPPHSSPSAAGAATALARTTCSRRSPPSESAAAPARYPSPRHRVPTSAAVDDGGNRLSEGDDAGQARSGSPRAAHSRHYHQARGLKLGAVALGAHGSRVQQLEELEFERVTGAATSSVTSSTHARPHCA